MNVFCCSRLSSKFICSKIVFGVLLALSLVVSGCTTSRKVDVVQSKDSGLSCPELRAEFKRLDEVEKEIANNRGSGNVGALIFWLPGVAYSEADADKAMQLVRERRTHLNGLYEKSNC